MVPLGVGIVLLLLVIALCVILMVACSNMDNMRKESRDSLSRHEKELEELRERAATFAKVNVESLVNAGIIVDDGEWLAKRLRFIPLRKKTNDDE